MKIELRNNKDFLAGLLLIGFGAFCFYMALSYPFGSALRMGPGYFPRVLSGILMTFGIIVLVRGLKLNEKISGGWGWKQLAFIVASVWSFGWIMDRWGFFPALVVMFFLACLAGSEFKLKEVVILTAFMSLMAWAIFIWGLGLPYPLYPGQY